MATLPALPRETLLYLDGLHDKDALDSTDFSVESLLNELLPDGPSRSVYG